MAHDKPLCEVAVSIVICTYGRPESLNATLESLTHQTFTDFEVILVTEKGDLSALRDKGLRSAVGSIVSFIDDDVYCPPTWLQSVVKSFREGVVGVTGPTTITAEYQKNRDCLKYKKLRQFQEWLFAVPTTPGKLSLCGAPSMVSNDEGCEYDGEVEYLECCNASVRKQGALDVGGFDHNYKHTSEWCEVDLALKLKEKGTLFFSKHAGLYHKPSKAGIYVNRLKTKHRWENFVYFQRRWIRPSFRRHLYWVFIWLYLKMKELRIV
jgi:glycosyltransferase involved in cell wall biosynthesis